MFLFGGNNDGKENVHLYCLDLNSFKWEIVKTVIFNSFYFQRWAMFLAAEMTILQLSIKIQCIYLEAS